MDDLIISEELIFNNISGDFEEIIKQVGQKLQEMGIVKASYADAVIAREKEYPTGLEGLHGSFAIPHTYCEHCIRSALVIIRPSRPMEFTRMDDHSQKLSCGLLIMLAINKTENQLVMLRKLMKAMQKETIFQILQREPSVRIVVDTLKEACL